ncbi:CatB-related O-acetyltransferase [Chitinophagaceae bacterium 26-R-25]|nr:CatB-related O-acetyltransferase [Chitinophagaceae bacterium 26-R-25]
MLTSLKKLFLKSVFEGLITNNYNASGATVEAGNNTRLFGNYFEGKIIVGDYSKILRAHIFGHVSIGRFSSLNGPNLTIQAGTGKIEIGSFCSIAPNVSFQVQNHNMKKLTTYEIFKNFYGEENHREVISKGDIRVGHDVWIGTHTVILGNVTIGNGAIVAANSTVTTDVPPFAIVGGSPARVIKYRFTDSQIDIIQKSQWWLWDEEQLNKRKYIFENELADLDDEKLAALLSQ